MSARLTPSPRARAKKKSAKVPVHFHADGTLAKDHVNSDLVFGPQAFTKYEPTLLDDAIGCLIFLQEQLVRGVKTPALLDPGGMVNQIAAVLERCERERLAAIAQPEPTHHDS